MSSVGVRHCQVCKCVVCSGATLSRCAMLGAPPTVRQLHPVSYIHPPHTPEHKCRTSARLMKKSRRKNKTHPTRLKMAYVIRY